MEQSFELNGKSYQPIVRETKSNLMKSKMGSKVFSLMMAYGMMGGFSGGNEPQRPDVDIVEEYGLIELKKSTLSKSQRDWVAYQFKKNFKEIQPNVVTN